MIVRILVRVLFALLSGLAAAVAATDHAEAQQLAFRAYGPERGLSNLGIACLQQDKAGFLLVCTDNGLFRFDGRSFTRYGAADGLPEHGLSLGLHVAPDGHVFVVDAGTLHVGMDRTDPRFVPVAGSGPIENDTGTRTALLGNAMLLLSAGRLSLVQPDARGVFRAHDLLSPALLQDVPALRTITGIAVSGDTLWLGCAGGHLCRLRCTLASGSDAAACSDATVYGPQDGVPAQDWIAILVDQSGTLWARAPDSMLVHHAGESRFSVEPLPGGVGRYAGRTYRLTIAEDPRGRIVTQGPHGLLIRDSTHWLTIDHANGLPDGEISAILFDHEGSLWLGMRAQGLFRAVGFGTWENWSVADGLSDNLCWQLARSGSGPLRIANDHGVDAMAASGPHPISQLPLNGPTLAVAVTPSGRVWAASLAGLLRRYSPQTGRVDATFQVPLTEAMQIDRAGDLLLGTRAGLYRLAGPDAPDAVAAAPVLVAGTHGHVRTFTEDQEGLVWLFADGHLIRVDPAGRQPPVTEPITIATPSRAMAFASPDDLWFGTDNDGLQHVVLSHGRPVRMGPIAHPLPSPDLIVSIGKDQRGWLWIGSDRGINIWNGQRWQHLDEEDGLLSNDLNQDSLLADRDGSMWFGTGHGLSHLIAAPTVFTRTTLHPVITDKLLDGVPITRRSIPWSPASLTIRFSALDFQLAGSIRFRYRLLGVDRDWVETADGTVRYPVLPSGRLVFSVQAIDTDRQLFSDPVSFTLEVRPPWWGTIWFGLLVAVAAIAAVTACWRLRVRLLLKRQRQLEALVAIRTAEIARANEALKAQASHDGLTGLLNRTAITAELESLLDHPARCDGLAVALADLDHFKSINDNFGHLGGDDVLRQVSARLAGVLAPGELAGRYGGEEFVLVIPASDNPLRRLQVIRNSMLQGPVNSKEGEIPITCSFGLTRFQPGDNRESMLRRADRLLYQAKHDGRDRIVADP